MVHMSVRLGHHELLDAHRPRRAHAPEVIALEVDQHDVLGALLGMRDESGGLCAVFFRLPAARPSPCDGSRLDLGTADPDQTLGRGA